MSKGTHLPKMSWPCSCRFGPRRLELAEGCSVLPGPAPLLRAAGPPRYTDSSISFPKRQARPRGSGGKTERTATPTEARGAQPFSNHDPRTVAGQGGKRTPQPVSRAALRDHRPRAPPRRRDGRGARRPARRHAPAPQPGGRGGGRAGAPQARAARGLPHTYSLPRLRPGSTNQEPKRVEGRGGARTNEVRKPRPRGPGRRAGTSGENTAPGSRLPPPAHPAGPLYACEASVNPFLPR